MAVGELALAAKLSFSPPFRAPAWVLQRFCACNKRLFSLIRLKPRVLFMLASYHRLPIIERERGEREKRRERREKNMVKTFCSKKRSTCVLGATSR